MRALHQFTHLFLFLALTQSSLTWGAPHSIESIQKSTETQIRNLMEPLLDKYCHEECKLLSVNASIDLAERDETAPGFTEASNSSDQEFAPSSATIKLLLDEKIGPISRKKLLELLEQYLSTLKYPVTIDSQITHFPQPIGSESKIAELRDRISRQFQTTVSDLLRQFCSDHCLFVDFQLKTEPVNGEESQYGPASEFIQEGNVSLRVREITGTLLFDETLSPEDRTNILEMLKLKTKQFNHVNIASQVIKFPKPSQSVKTTPSENSNTAQNNTTSSTNNSTHRTEQNQNKEENTKQERFERIEKIERVENGDAIQSELQTFKVYGLIFGLSILSLLLLIAIASVRSPKGSEPSTVHRVIQHMQDFGRDSMATMESQLAPKEISPAVPSPLANIKDRYDVQRLTDELNRIFTENPKVAKYVFTRILTEEGLDIASKYIHIFGEGIVIDMLYDPSLQSDLSELMEYYVKTPIELKESDKLDLLRKLHNRTVAGKLAVLGNRSSHLFDFLTEMDSIQILEMIRNESLTVKAIVLTQCDIQKRSSLYVQFDEPTRMKLLTELSRIDYLPRDYVFNVANALKRKRRDNPRLNTEALPGSEVLVTLLERTGVDIQRDVIKNLEISSPESARTVKNKLVSIDTLRYLRDNQLLEIILGLKHEELLQFLKGAHAEIRSVIFSKSPKELVAELEEELEALTPVSREIYSSVERKILNRVKIMANDGIINLVETNERMFSDQPLEPSAAQTETTSIKKVAGW